MKKPLLLLSFLAFILTSTNCIGQAFSVPYSEDFETGSPGWNSDSATTPSGGAWELGMPNYGMTNSTHSGNNCWDVNLNSTYVNNCTSHLLSPEFNLSGLTAVRISFWANYNIEQAWDGFVLQYTTDTVGNNWNTVGTINAQYSSNWYTDSVISFPGSPAWTGTSGGWVLSSIVVPTPIPAGHVWYRFLFTSDASVTVDGVSIDDFSIEPEYMNVISGTVYLDVNSNNVIDAGDTPLPNVILNATPVNIGNYQVTNSAGNYAFLADSGVATTITPYPPLYSVVIPDSTTVTIPGNNQTSNGNDFLVTFLPGISDPTIHISSSGVRPGMNHTKYISYSNLGTVPVSGTIELTYDAACTFLSASEPSTQIGPNTIEFNYSLLLPGQSGNISCLFLADSTLVIGDSLFTSGVIYPVSGDTNTSNNYDTQLSIVTNSVDPNNKLVDPEGDILVADVSAGLDLDYTVNFQNIGNAPAIDINIFDQLDQNLDLSTLDIIGSSNPITAWNIGPNRVLHITFENINLPGAIVNEPASHGYIAYRVRPDVSLQVGETISNTAFIYFDNNLPIATNTVMHTVVLPTSLADANHEGNILLYPNPAGEQFTFIHPSGYEKWELVNTLGQTVINGIISTQITKSEVSVSELPIGIYLFRIEGQKQSVLSAPLLITR